MCKGSEIPMNETATDLLLLAEKLREVGNIRFRLGDVQGALRDYDEVLNLLARPCLVDDHAADSDLQTRLKACRLPAQLNAALCCLKLTPSKAERALVLCEAALGEEPDNVKALYRKAKALLALDQVEKAEAGLARVCFLTPEDKALQADLDSVRRQLEQIHGREPTLDTLQQLSTQDIHEQFSENLQIPGRQETLENAAEENRENQHSNQSLFSLLNEDEDPWVELEVTAEQVRLATERHADLWKQVRACLAERDTWNNKLSQLKREADVTLSLENQLEAQKLRGAAATSRSKQCVAQGRAYAATERRARKLDQQVLKLLREIRALEQDTNTKIDPCNRLPEIMDEAVLQDDPSKVQGLLSSLPSRLSSQRVEDIIQKRPELSIRDLKRRINECKQQMKKDETNVH